MVCDRCRRADACWHDTYLDEAVCNACCPDRSTAYGQEFVEVLHLRDAQRLSSYRNDTNGDDGRW